MNGKFFYLSVSASYKTGQWISGFPEIYKAKIFFKTKFVFSFGMLGRISTIIEIIVNCIVCEREIGILASSLAMGLG
jgi:hypothetical protein